MKLAILGFGREGKSVLAFLTRRLGFKKSEIEILDRTRTANYLRDLERFNVIFRSPGIPWNLPEFARARKRGVLFSSATKLFFDHCPAPIVGITGTKGKGTTATLVYNILRAAGRDVHLAGNIGVSPLEILPRLTKKSLVILELSSFQLQDIARSPQTAVVLELFPDHQDHHRSLAEYYGAKANIARHQKKNDRIFYFKHNALSRWVAAQSRGTKTAVDEKKFKLFAPSDLRIPGAHNFKNAAMAATVARALGVPQKTILRTVKNFHGTEHRLEFVRSITAPATNNHSHILKNMRTSFWNDSASTNPHTTAAALRAFPGEMKILIAGGQDKGLVYAPLAQALRGVKNETKRVILYGENKKKIAHAIRGTGIEVRFTPNLAAAVRAAYRAAQKPPSAHRPPIINRTSSIVILFSPGAASFDQFKNYAERGEQFKKLVKKLKSR